MTFREALLGRPWLFRLFNRNISRANRDAVVNEYIRPVKDELIIDVGCGYENLASRLSHANYLGIDISRRYIEYTNRHYENFGRFVSGNIIKDSTLV